MHMHQLLGEGSVACTGMWPWPRGSSSLPHADKYCAHNSTHDMSSVFEMAVAKKSNIYCKDVTRRPLVLDWRIRGSFLERVHSVCQLRDP